MEHLIQQYVKLFKKSSTVAYNHKDLWIDTAEKFEAAHEAIKIRAAQHQNRDSGERADAYYRGFHLSFFDMELSGKYISVIGAGMSLTMRLPKERDRIIYEISQYSFHVTPITLQGILPLFMAGFVSINSSRLSNNNKIYTLSLYTHASLPHSLRVQLDHDTKGYFTILTGLRAVVDCSPPIPKVALNKKKINQLMDSVKPFIDTITTIDNITVTDDTGSATIHNVSSYSRSVREESTTPEEMFVDIATNAWGRTVNMPTFRKMLAIRFNCYEEK